MSEQLVAERLARDQAHRDRIDDLQKIANLQQHLAILQVRFDAYVQTAPNDADLDGLREEARKLMNEIAEAQRHAMQTTMAQGFAAFETAFEEKQRKRTERTMNRAAVIFAVLASLLIGGFDLAFKTMQATGFLPAF